MAKREKAEKLLGIRVRRLSPGEEGNLEMHWCVEIGLVHPSGRWTSTRKIACVAATFADAQQALRHGLVHGFGEMPERLQHTLVPEPEATKPAPKPRVKDSEKPITVRIWCEDDKKPSSTRHYMSPETAAVGTKGFLIQRMRYGYGVDFRDWVNVDAKTGRPLIVGPAENSAFCLAPLTGGWPRIEVTGCALWQFRGLLRAPKGTN